jgi:hypothetical protein
MNLKKALKKSVKVAKNGDLKDRDLKPCLPDGFPQGVRMTREGEFMFPDAPGTRADILYVLREERLKLQRVCELYEKAEGALRDYFIETLPASEASGLSGTKARVQIESRPVPQVEDWPKLYAHIKKTNNFELLQRRVNEGAVKERWEDKKQVPGVGVFIAKKVSCTKI